jgi:hypothetical protein
MTGEYSDPSTLAPSIIRIFPILIDNPRHIG